MARLKDYYNKEIIINVYDLFEFINIFRLLPYSKNNDILQFIVNLIKNKIKEKH